MRIRTGILDTVCLAGLILLLLGGGGVVSALCSAKAKLIARHNKRVEARLSEVKAVWFALAEVDRVLAANEAALQALRARIPESRRIGECLAKLDGLMNKNAVSLHEVTPGEPTAEALCMRTPLSFACRGEFRDLHAVLYGLQRMERLVYVERATIGRGSLSGACEMNVSCGVYGR